MHQVQELVISLANRVETIASQYDLRASGSALSSAPTCAVPPMSSPVVAPSDDAYSSLIIRVCRLESRCEYFDILLQNQFNDIALLVTSSLDRIDTNLLKSVGSQMEHVPETFVTPSIVADEYRDENICRVGGRIQLLESLAKLETPEKLLATKLRLFTFPTQDAILETGVTAVDVSGSGSAAGASAGWKTARGTPAKKPHCEDSKIHACCGSSFLGSVTDGASTLASFDSISQYADFDILDD